MAYISRPFECTNSACGHTWDDLVTREEENHQKCPVCGAQAKWLIAAAGIATYSLMDADAKAQHLRKRSRDHTRKMLKKDPSSIKMSRHVVGKK